MVNRWIVMVAFAAIHLASAEELSKSDAPLSHAAGKAGRAFEPGLAVASAKYKVAFVCDFGCAHAVVVNRTRRTPRIRLMFIRCLILKEIRSFLGRRAGVEGPDDLGWNMNASNVADMAS